MDQTARKIAQRLRERGHVAYFAGGCVRDMVRGLPAKDFDIATDATPDIVQKIFPRTYAVGAAFGVVVVVENGFNFEVATFRSDGAYLDHRHPVDVRFSSPEEDAKRRDFTINGMFFDPEKNEVIDFVGGRDDLKAKLIRAIGDPAARFSEDRLRMLRAVRFATVLDYKIDNQTWSALVASAASINEISAERIRDELVRLLVVPGRAKGVRLLHASGLLQAVLPEVAATAGVPQPPEFHPEGDVFTHTVLALEHLRNPSPVLAMATLLHDIGKPPTLSVSDRIRFNEHDVVGAEMAGVICRRVRFSGGDTERIVALVRNHLRVKDLPKMRPAKATRFLLDPASADHLELHRADCLASHGNLDVYQWAMASLQELAAQPPDRGHLISGDDLLKLGYAPGPQYKTILDYVEDARLEGKVRTREEALALIRTVFPPPGRTGSLSGELTDGVNHT